MLRTFSPVLLCPRLARTTWKSGLRNRGRYPRLLVIFPVWPYTGIISFLRVQGYSGRPFGDVSLYQTHSRGGVPKLNAFHRAIAIAIAQFCSRFAHLASSSSDLKLPENVYNMTQRMFADSSREAVTPLNSHLCKSLLRAIDRSSGGNGRF